MDGAISSSSVNLARSSRLWEARLGRMPRYPNAFTRTRSLCPISPLPPRVPRSTLPKAFTGIRSPCSPCTLRTKRHDLAERTVNPTFTCTPRLTFFARGAELREGRGSLACSSASAADCWSPWPALSEARGATAEVGHTVGVLCAPKEPISFRLKQPGVCL